MIGEGEKTFLEIVRCLQENKPVQGIPGTAWRDFDQVPSWPPRERIADLDTLAPPINYFDLHTILTSRGCPMHCTFCGSRLMWGKQVRFHSAEYVLDMLETAVNGGVSGYLSIKDDTFTADRARALAICEGIRKRRLEFIWSCDTRADYLDDALLSEMRQSGCTRISMGVESASTAILRNINKRLSLDQLFDVTQSAKKYGIQTRYYMMAGNRGETLETFHQSLDFIRRARPNQFVFSQLHLYPGTEEFDIFMRHGLVSPEIFFTRNFFCLTCFAGDKDDEKHIRKIFKRHFRGPGLLGIRCCGLPGGLDPNAGNAFASCGHCAGLICGKAIRMPPSGICTAPSSWVFFCRDWSIILYACIAAARNDIDGSRFHLDEAFAIHPHQVVIENLERLESWLDSSDTQNSTPLKLAPGNGFESSFICRQPECPDPSCLELRPRKELMMKSASDNWESAVVSPETAIEKIRPGMLIFLGTAMAEPRTMVRHLMTSDAKNLEDLELIQLISFGDAVTLQTIQSQNFRLKTFFSGWVANEAIEAGRVDLIPSRHAKIPQLIESRQIPVDVAIVQITPPNAAGFCSLGIAVDVAREAMEQASIRIGEINTQIPRTFGDTFVQTSEFDFLIRSTDPPIYFDRSITDDCWDQVARHVAPLIEDKSCLAFSIGPFYEALARCLTNKRHLGIHSPVFTDPLMDLMKCGASPTVTRKHIAENR